MKVAICLGTLGTGSLKKDIQRCLAIGVQGLQLRVVDTELDPKELTGSGREEFADYIESFGFEVPSLWGALGGFADPGSMDERMNRTRAMLDLCVELRCPLLCVEPGAAPENGTQAYSEFTGALRDLANYALERDVRLAVTTGTDSAERLAQVLADVKSEGARVNYDPAALVARGHDPLSGFGGLSRAIAHVQARDAVRGSILEPGEEVSLTKGDSGIEALLQMLNDVGYTAFLSVATERDADLAAIAVESVTWLKKQDGVDP